MRLTLRTLLAYLDDVLDPADKEELARKIESSDFAEDLVHRTRDTVRRLRLSAPQVIGSGIGLDPNSVAEYLDNVMAPDAVGDFERICLESDVHLAEAAACHHVLTMILGQPADVDPLARQRMYTIATEAGERKILRVEPAHVTTEQIVAAAAVGRPATMPATIVQEPHKVQIPEYLRAGGWRRSWGAMATIAAVVIIGIAVLVGTGWRNWFGTEQPVAKGSPSAPANENETPIAPTGVESATSKSQTDSVATTSTPALPAAPVVSPPQKINPDTLASTPSRPTTTPDEPDRYAIPNAATNTASTANTAPQTPAPSGTTTIPPPVVRVNANAGAPGNTTGNVPPAPAGPMPSNTVSNVPPSPAGPIPGTVSNQPPLPPQPSADASPSTATPSTSAPSPTTIAASEGTALPVAAANVMKTGGKPQLPAGPVELGTYMGGKTVLLRHDGKSDAWFRIEPRAAITVGERLLALPEFRPKIALVSGMNLDISGGTQVVMVGGSKPILAASPDAGTAAEIPEVEIVYGRIVFVNSAQGDGRVRLKVGPHVGEAKLARNTTFAVEVERQYVPGQDPRKTPSPIECRLFAPDGGVVWKDAAGSKIAEKASRWTLGEKGATSPVADPSPPDWIYNEPIGQLSEQKYGAPKIESTLVSNIPAETQLLELFQSSKQQEVKSLVTRSCINVGQFVPFVEALRDSEQKWSWKSHISALRAAMALSPDSANKVWQTLVDQRGRPAATDLYEMLCGYTADEVGRTPEQMKTGAVAKLIDWLENDSLDYRVLAWNDLREVTGKQLLSNPADTLSTRTRAIRAWRERLEKGDLKPVSPTQ
ncbi:MAG TPA: hypothetical protein VHE81_04465 [Lacipirellulaceae bacterium]|nr:hypothetical protein [Lacipirellulaceae bacterium]